MTKRSQMNMVNASWCGFVILLLVASLLGACASLPDTSGYTAATIQVKQAVAATGDIVEGELRSAIKSKATTANDESVKNLKAAWAATTRSLDAMVAHAQSIEQIVDAGNRGEKSAKEVADSVKNLVDAVKVDALTGASAKLVELSVDTVAFVYGEYSKHVAAKSLEEALDKFGPSIAKITALIQSQIADARRLFVEQIEAQVQLLQSPTLTPEDVGNRFGDWIKRHGELEETAELATRLLVRGIKDDKPNDIAKAKAMISDVETGRKMVAPRLVEYKEMKRSIHQRERAGCSVIGASEKSVAAWGMAHQQLLKAVKGRKPVSVESLTATVVEIRTLIQRWREL
ncbi:MAG: hypothetical protein JRJ85_12765 [Deltaproteobacteria bacterium]|nr:hypothetical protein [Deltaproteobacteria bacterium]